MHDVVIITYWWGHGICKNTTKNYLRQKMKSPGLTYPQLVKRMRTQAKRHGFLFDAQELPANSSYQNAISYKATFIKKMLEKWKKPVLYLDCDMCIHKPPVIFTTNQYDFMAFNWNADARVAQEQNTLLFDWSVLETSGGIFYFNNTKNAMSLLHSWEDALTKHPTKADDRLLAITFVKTNAQQWLRYYWIPVEYFYVPQYYYNVIPNRQVVISHPYALTNEDKALTLAGTSCRVPKTYRRIVERKADHMTTVVEYQHNNTMLESIYHRNETLNTSSEMTYILNPTPNILKFIPSNPYIIKEHRNNIKSKYTYKYTGHAKKKTVKL